MGDHLKMRELARELIRDSIVEDALAQFLSLALEHVHDEHIKPLRAEIERLRYVLEGVRGAIDTGRNEPLQIWRDQIEIALQASAALKRVAP